MCKLIFFAKLVFYNRGNYLLIRDNYEILGEAYPAEWHQVVIEAFSSILGFAIAHNLESRKSTKIHINEGPEALNRFKQLLDTHR